MTALPAPDSGVSRASPVHAALQQLEAHGAVWLPGRRSDVLLRWLGRRRVLVVTMLSIGGVGVLLAIAGLLWRDKGLWALMLPVGALLAFAAAVAGGGVWLNSHLMVNRLRAETQPVVDPAGLTMRGIGPIPWSFVASPIRQHIWVKYDIGGDCTVMPLTPEGRAVVNAQPNWWRTRVGPRPYLRTDFPYLLLPGIEGFTEDETLQLFRIAQERYARRR